MEIPELLFQWEKETRKRKQISTVFAKLMSLGRALAMGLKESKKGEIVNPH